MCGLAGFVNTKTWGAPDVAHGILLRMSEAIRKRGPDDLGIWHDRSSGLGLVHRRLSILDLSSAGHQPMSCAFDRFVIAFNGEIYNHLELRKELESSGFNYIWRGHSDTETLLAGINAWGLKGTISRCIGMFAFAIWDKLDRILVLGRDRLGEKPLYYGWQGEADRRTFVFGSDIGALKAHPAFSKEVNRDAICLLVRHSYIPAPHSIYKGIYKLPAGHLLSLGESHDEPCLEQYWSLSQSVQNWSASTYSGNSSDAINALDSLLSLAVKQQMIADVPLGAFLSGGVDSSTIVSLMQAQSVRPIKTFSIGFNEHSYNEAEYARAVAKHLGTDHTELYITSEQALDVIPKIPALYSEPFSDSSQIPTFLVSQLASQHVKVALSGDAGDELFAGYNRYVLTHNLWNKVDRFPAAIRSVAASSIRSISPARWSKIISATQPLLPLSLRMTNGGDKLHKAALALAARSIDELYLGLVTHWEPDSIVINANEPLTALRGAPLDLNGLDSVQRMMLLDSISYLPDDILVKVDRASMGVSLECRVPFLDHRIIEFAWRLPQHLKIREGGGKWLLRQLLYRYVPKELIDRPKMGFGVPLDTWLRGPLRDWAENLLDPNRLEQEGYFKVAPIRQKWKEHLSGRNNWQHHLWNILMFQAWLESQ